MQYWVIQLDNYTNNYDNYITKHCKIRKGIRIFLGTIIIQRYQQFVYNEL